MIGWLTQRLGLTLALATWMIAQCAVARAEEVAQAEPLAWSMQLAAEAGIGMRNVRLPRDGVIYQIDAGAYPVLGVAFELEHRSSQRLSLGLVGRYQSSIGLTLDEQLTEGTRHPRKTRSHHFEVGIAPSLRWDDSGWAITSMLGYSVAELDPENHLVTPSYHLGGPSARIGGRIPLGSKRVRLNVSGEAQWIAQIGDELRARGVAASGLGAGADAALELSLNERWLLAASYRELHFWLGTTQGPSFSDGLRVVTAQLRGTL